MTLQLYELINTLVFIMAIMGLVLPAIIIYFYSAYKNYWALLISAVAIGLMAFAANEYAVILLPLILPILITGIVGTLLRKSQENFWNSMGYMIMAQMGGAILGIITIYFYYNMQDIAELISEGFRSAFSSISPNDEAGVFGLDLVTWTYMIAVKGAQVHFSDVTALTITEKIDFIVPILRQLVSGALPSAILNYGIIGGVWAWFISSEMIGLRARHKKELKGIKEYVKHPPFSGWKLPRWLTNVLMVILLAAIVLSFASEGPLLNVATVLQSVAIVVIGIQGLSVVNWWLKKKKVPTILNVIICIASVILLNFLLPWIGVFDIVFSIRVSKEQKKEIRARMEEIKKQVDEQMRVIEEEKEREKENEEDIKDQDENKNDEQDESEESK